MPDLRLRKSEKLCSAISVDALFAPRSGAKGALAFPLRMVWRPNEGRTRGARVQFLISVPKTRLRHAVDRGTMRRRIREAYRLHRDLIPVPTDGAATTPLDVAFVYVGPGLLPYRKIEAAMTRLLPQLSL
ncbi:MAG: ribonuclease P protein component [Muribaculaceae bacterium]|nr:ribonuclease P protein component [Muribaculaceae bacterium]